MIDITFELEQSFFKIRAAFELFLLSGLPKTRQALKKGLKHIHNEWANTAKGSFKSWEEQGYISHIQTIDPSFEDPLGGKVINRLIYAWVMEKGMSSADRMKILQTSHQIRRVKKGVNKGAKYLIIPFRHGTPGTLHFKPMPAGVYKKAKELEYTKRTGTYYEYSQQLVEATSRDFGLISKFGPPAHLGKPRATEAGFPMARRFTYSEWHHLEGIGAQYGKDYEGMVKMGEPRQTQYMTFRVMSEVGKPWAGIKALNIVGRTAGRVRPEVMRLLSGGYKEDFKDCLRMAE